MPWLVTTPSPNAISDILCNQESLGKGLKTLSCDVISGRIEMTSCNDVNWKHARKGAMHGCCPK